MANTSTHPSSIDARGASTPDANEIVSRVAQGAHETVDRLAEKAAPAAQKLESTVAHASEALHNQVNRARELGDEWTDNLRGTVREHPLTSVGVALAIGMLFARLTR
ncbi:DUF883 family protein [Hydrogenophaga sp.]|jgi:ElaB/YqjD/DUF883 family membrane-anchored ribosome-binding protein|uniref:DUF883 family protein n=1 Tax=Hydrogenophaga sp. TaxID=1904254 RepID=UPI003F6FA62C